MPTAPARCARAKPPSPRPQLGRLAYIRADITPHVRWQRGADKRRFGMDRSYLHENSPSHQHWEDKHEWAESVVRWGTTCEPSVTICPFCPFVRLPGTPGARGGHGRVGGGSGAGQGAWEAGGVAASQPSSGTAATAGAAGLCFGRWAPGEARRGEGQSGRAGAHMHDDSSTRPACARPPASQQPARAAGPASPIPRKRPACAPGAQH